MAVKVFIPKVLSVLTLLSDIVIIILFLYFIYRVISGKKIRLVADFLDFLGKNAILFAFIVALTATLGSLFYSEVMGYEPCKLCWFQRIFMYPMVLLFGIALIKNDRKMADYTIVLSIIGAFIALYHYIIQMTNYSTACGISSQVPCTIKYTFTYGYIVIPMMALTAFILIMILMYLVKRKKN